MKENKTKKYKLPNGLEVHLKEIHTAPIISHWVWYRVGSRNEKPGKTGISHWVEHMLFKGTEKFPASISDRVISREGGIWNAFTFLDWTAFFETMPADKIDLALDMESDRMMNCLFDKDEVESERTVVLSEREGNENEPLMRLDEQMQMKAFDQHPYRNEVIGLADDIRSITRDDLYQHYRRYYAPNNAVLAIAGDFDMATMVQKVEQYYSKVPSSNLDAQPIPAEAALTAERRVEISGPGDTTYLRVSYRAPAAANDDFFAFSVLDSVLSGPSGLNMFGGGNISNKTSRLYQALVDSEITVSVSGGIQSTIDPFLYTFTMIVRPEKSPEEALQILDAEIAKVQQQVVGKVEIHKAIKQAKAMFAYGSENVTNQAFWLGYAEMFDDYSWFEEYIARLEQVNPQAVQLAANKYLSAARRVVGIYTPQMQEGSVS
ncbi:MAG: insulinase family protein [Anaerolineaceae bacterium]|nr:insulinase family protein [Anaerolineaceae bacterium]